MELVCGYRRFVPPAAGCVVTVGNFDGVHLGHQALLQQVREIAAARGSASTVVLFEPHPREYFSGDAAPRRVLELRSKLHVLADHGIERVLCLPFGRRLAEMPATDFIEQILIAGMHTRHLIVGDDFRFGACRNGDAAMLRRAGTHAGFEVSDVPQMVQDGARVSSTRLRLALGDADLAAAERLLGRPYAIWGRVRHGLRLGRKLGMPTANIIMRHPPALRHGVYAVRVRHGEQESPGVASLGVRPTLSMTECVLEDHLFTQPGDLYGREIHTRFVAFLRPQMKFATLDALGVQMHADAQRARELLDA